MPTQISRVPVARSQSRNSVCKLLMIKVLAKLRHGYLEIIDGDESYRFGDPAFPLHAEIRVYDPSFYSKALLQGTVGAGESYIDGHWDSPALTQLVQLLVRNMPLLDRLDHVFAAPVQWAMRFANLFKINSKKGSKRNILAHYDLGNDFYKLFLDDTLAYSCALFENKEQDLYGAQCAKFKTICERLELKAGDKLLEIGTGWGGLAVYAATHYGVQVTTTTISEQQYQYTESLIASHGLEDNITLLKKDYRDLDGQYDKLVSIEMLEAVGHRYLNTYFVKCESLLKPGGRMLIQSITIADQRYDRYRRQVDFIQRYVFPGGFLPSINALSNSLKRRTQLQISDVHDMGQHYATTLRHWSERLQSSRQSLEQQGRDQSFYRLWQFYFQYCEGGFLEGSISTVHLLINKPRYLLDPSTHNNFAD